VLQQDAGNANVALQQDYMTLLSHTMSQEDYAKACEDGFDPSQALFSSFIFSCVKGRSAERNCSSMLRAKVSLPTAAARPEEGAVSYLVDNGLEPEIWNLYVAENSGAKVQNNDVPQELQEQMDGDFPSAIAAAAACAKVSSVTG